MWRDISVPLLPVAFPFAPAMASALPLPELFSVPEPFPKEPICVHIICNDLEQISARCLIPFLANLRRPHRRQGREFGVSMAVEASSGEKGKWGWSDVVYVGMILGSLLGFVMHWR